MKSNDNSKIDPINIKQLMGMTFPSNLWLVEPLIPHSGIVIISAPPVSLKTWLLVEIARCVSSGSEFLGEFACDKRNVLIVDEESGLRRLQDRFRRLDVAEDLEISLTSLMGFNILNDEHFNQLIDYCVKENIGLLIFDSLVRIHAGDENDAGSMAKVFQRLRKLTSFGVAIVLAHHNRKSSGRQNSENLSSEMRGSTDILAALDSHIAVIRSGNLLTIKQTKSRDAEELDAFQVTFDTNEPTFKLQYTGESQPRKSKFQITKDLVTDHLGQHGLASQKELLNNINNSGGNISLRTLRDALNTLKVEGILISSKGDRNTTNYKLSKGNDI